MREEGQQAKQAARYAIGSQQYRPAHVRPTDIAGFTENILPPESQGMLILMSNIGLVWFLLLVGLETDTDLIAKVGIASRCRACR